jgi:hypothetical protein
MAGADVEEIYEAKRDVSVDKTQEKFNHPIQHAL